MAMSQKIMTGKATPKGKPTVGKGPSQKAPITTPKHKGGKGGC